MSSWRPTRARRTLSDKAVTGAASCGCVAASRRVERHVDRTIIKHRDHQQEQAENGGRHSGEQGVARPRSWRGAGGTPKRGRMMRARVRPVGSECDSLSSPGVSAGGEVP